MPKRIQRKRTKGWRKPEGAIYIGRGSKWGNPHKMSDYDLLFTAVWRRRRAIQDWILDLNHGRLEYTREDIRRELKGQDVMCWCSLAVECHGDYLLKIANG